MTPRISPLGIDEVSEAIRQVFIAHESRAGYISPVLKVLAHRPEFVTFYDAAMNVQSLSETSITPLERFLLQAKVAVANHSPYAMKYFQRKNDLNGFLPAHKFEALFRPAEGNHHFTEKEQLVLGLGERLGANAVVDDAFWASLRAEFSEAELLDLLVIGAVESFYATFVRGLGLTSLDLPQPTSPNEGAE